MKAIAINGSARGQKGITGRMLKSFINGLKDNGCEVEEFNTCSMNIKPCTSCFYCMHKNPGKCNIEDDMNDIYPNLKSADLFIIASPLYVDNMSAQMKSVLDRCISSMKPFLIKDENNRYRHSFTWNMPRNFVLVSTAGFPEYENFDSLLKTVNAIAYNFGSKVIAGLCIPGSIALQMDLTLLDHHLKLIYDAGSELAKNGEIKNSTVKAINSPVLSDEKYHELYLKYENWCKEKLG